MKRSSSVASSSPQTTTTTHTPTPSPKKDQSTPNKRPKRSQASENGTWTPEKRAMFIDDVLASGYKAIDLDSLATKLGLSKRQLVDQLVPHKSNLRAKAVKAVRGD
ncbi:hypothetical protein BCR39DRAFT_474779 [Naematelia encephala]|uniref:Uncharacterized protein n=1 Tax=Naematelia encephala TaxID=71784 RepID=A0A1Y2AFC4_9TREE|nr:hypothetical protein BCR39DRAFT_474779 [Naematelia encephala]